MILVIDIGNTNMVLGIYQEEKLIGNWRLTTGTSRTSDETGILMMSLFNNDNIDHKKIESVIISSVVPDIMYSLVLGIKKYFRKEPMIVSSDMVSGLTLNMENPKELGSDRIVNMVAAKEIYGGPAVVIDYGTATTFDVIGGNGEFITGITAPGIQICAEALYKKAAKLPKIEIKKPESIFIKNTVGSIQAGLVFGKIGETIYIVDKLKKELNEPNLKVVATGGLARIIDDENKIFDHLDPQLTLKGLRILYHKNK